MFRSIQPFSAIQRPWPTTDITEASVTFSFELPEGGVKAGVFWEDAGGVKMSGCAIVRAVLEGWRWEVVGISCTEYLKSSCSSHNFSIQT